MAWEFVLATRKWQEFLVQSRNSVAANCAQSCTDESISSASLVREVRSGKLKQFCLETELLSSIYPQSSSGAAALTIPDQ